MKKSLIALAALATVATAAQAQSSVTIYGVMDMGYGSVSGVGAGDKRVSGIQNGGLSTSRIGFKGTEDLGGGLSAGFTLETEILGDTGTHGAAPATDALFQRGAFVTLESKSLGSISLGRQNYDEYATSVGFDPFSGNNIGGWVAQAQYGAARFSNGITVKTASFNGFGLTYQHVFGEVAGDTSKGQSYSIGANYASGPFAAAVISSRFNNADGNKSGENTFVYAKYNAGVAEVRTGTSNLKSFNATGEKTRDQDGYFVGAIVPVNAKINVMGIYAWYKDFGGVNNNRDPKGYALGGTYALSKRTTLYAIAAKSSQDNDSALNVVSTSKWGSAANPTAPGANNDQNAYTVGIRHTF